MLKKIALSSVFLASLFAQDITIENAFVKVMPPSTKNSAVFLDLVNNTDKTISLISASSNISEKVELHTHIDEDGMKKMIKIDSIEVPAKSTVSLRPGGMHIMLFDVKKRISENDRINVKLVFDNNNTLESEVKAKDMRMLHEDMNSTKSHDNHAEHTHH